MAPEWRDEINSLAFRPEGHEGMCIIHRRALETLLGRCASPSDCKAYFEAHKPAFAAAAAAKIARAMLNGGENFHLTSRDVARCRFFAQP